MKYTEICYHCRREYVNCEIRTCPVKLKPVCRYCCMKCKASEQAETGLICKERRKDVKE